MTDRLIVHIGPRKTGTTYVQRVLQMLAPELMTSGILYPTEFRGRSDYNHVSAVTDVTHEAETRPGGRWVGRGTDAWEGLRSQVAAWDGTTILSAEMLGGLRSTSARTFLDGLDARQIDVVITMRDLARIIPSSWQQHVRNTHRESYLKYIERREEERGQGTPQTREKEWDEVRHHKFWRSYSYGALVRRWAALVGIEHIRVVALPAPGGDSSLLWTRFVDALAIPEIPRDAPTLPRFISNVGSTAEEAAFLHAFNIEAGRRGWNRSQIKEHQQRLLSSGFLDRPHRGSTLALPTEYIPLVRSWADEDRQDLAGTGVPLWGEIDDLAIPESTRGTPPLDPEALAGAGAYALVDRLDRKAKSRKRSGDRNPLSPVRDLAGRARRRIAGASQPATPEQRPPRPPRA